MINYTRHDFWKELNVLANNMGSTFLRKLPGLQRLESTA